MKTTAVVVLLASVVFGQAPGQGGPLVVLSRDGRRPLLLVDSQGRQMVGLDDLATTFQLTVREDLAARAVTATYRDQTIVMTPDQSLVSIGGRLVSLPAPVTRQGRRFLVPIEFISRVLAPIYETKLELRAASRLVIVGDLRVPRVALQFDESPNSTRITFEVTPKTNATVVQETGHLLVRFEADTLDAFIPQVPTQQGLLAGVRAVEPNAVQLDLGPRFNSFRLTTPASNTAAAVLSVELLPAASESSAAPPPAVPATPIPDAPLPVFGASRPTIRTVVVDPGHGGDDTGVKGPSGGLEKQVNLGVARRLKSALESRLGVRVLLTHEGDTRIDADGRAAIANNNKADLFVSLHANGSTRAETRGTVIFTLGLDRFGEDARQQLRTDREVLPVYGGGSREVALVEWELAQAAHLEGSITFAELTEQKLRGATAVPSTTLVRAPMRSLAGANMPAILVEMGYLSNPEEEKLLASAGYQNAVAQALTEAIVAFRDHLERQAPAPPTP